MRKSYVLLCTMLVVLIRVSTSQGVVVKAGGNFLFVDDFEGAAGVSPYTWADQNSNPAHRSDSDPNNAMTGTWAVNYEYLDWDVQATSSSPGAYAGSNYLRVHRSSGAADVLARFESTALPMTTECRIRVDAGSAMIGSTLTPATLTGNSSDWADNARFILLFDAGGFKGVTNAVYYSSSGGWTDTGLRYTSGWNSLSFVTDMATGKASVTLNGTTVNNLSLLSTGNTNALVIRGAGDGHEFSVDNIKVTVTEPQITKGTATVDGDLSEWSDATWIALDKNYDENATDIAEASYAVRWSGEKVYVAVKVNDTAQMFTDSYHDWYTRDAVEVYVHTTGIGGSDNRYPNCEIAQQYTIGFKTTGNDLWAVLGNSSMYPNMFTIPSGADYFVAKGQKSGSWLYYEMEMKSFSFLGVVNSLPSVVSPLNVGDMIGVDVVAVANNNPDYTGMKSSNLLREKTAFWTRFATYRLVEGVEEPGVPGDVNGDGVVNAADIDALYAAIAAGSTASVYDLDGNGVVAKADVDYLIGTIIGTAYGDANLDKSVDVGDLGILAANYGGSGKTWAQGDFNGDGAVDVGDLGILAANYGTGVNGSADFSADYAKAFGTAVEDDSENDRSLCSVLGLPLIAGLLLAGLLLVKLEE